MLRLLVVSLLAAIGLTGCGGGGGGASPPPAPQAQSISFATAGPVDSFLGDSPTANVASGSAGTGAVTYTSDTPSVATVDAESGQVTIIAVGDATITASKAADAKYLSAQATYILHIAPRSVGVNAWIGTSDTEVSFQSPYLALDFTRSSDLTCNPANYSTCSDGAQTAISVSEQTDSAAALQRPAAYWLKHGSKVTDSIVLPEQKFGLQLRPLTAVMNGRHWLITQTYGQPNQVWSSADGSNWRLESASASFPARWYSKLVAFKNALWIIGGQQMDTGATLSDVWTSTDGKAWTQVTQAAWDPVFNWFAATAFNDRLRVVGGNGLSGAYNDVWSSSDGATWTHTAAPWPGRIYSELVAFNGRLWMIGGNNPGGVAVPATTYGDVWSSNDGATWTQETPAAEFGGRSNHRVVTDGQQLLLIAGKDGNGVVRRDAWSSTNGRNWIPIAPRADFSPRADHGAEYLNGQFWVIGGGDDEVWSSATGAHWTKNSLSAAIPGKSAVASVNFKSRLWVLGDDTQLWSSADGLSWTEEAHSTPAPAVFTSPFLFARGDQLLLVGGAEFNATGPNYFRQVWQSSDGKNWTKLTDSVPFDALNLNQVVDLNGKLLAFVPNSTNGGGTLPEVWSSTDGAGWSLLSAHPPFAPRYSYKVVVHNNLVWVIGGLSSGGFVPDVWSSADGAAWAQVTSNLTLPARQYGPSVSIGGNMCLYGNVLPLTLYEVWCSSDGFAWQKRSDDIPVGPVTVLNGTAFIVGTNKSRSWSQDIVWKSADGVAWRLGYSNTLRFP
jgi:Big-like domain-containing protein